MNDLTPGSSEASEPPAKPPAQQGKPPATRAQAAVALRLAGAPYTDIAESLAYATAADAQRAVESLLAATVEAEDLASTRNLYNQRLNRLLQSYWPRALNPKDPKQIEYGNMVLKIEERRARLMGTDAPTKHEVYTPTAEQITEQVKVLTANVIMPVEADIVDAEYDDDAQAG